MKKKYYSSRFLKLFVVLFYSIIFSSFHLLNSGTGGSSLLIPIYCVGFFLSLYIFKAFDEVTVRSFNSLMISFAYATFSGGLILFAFIGIFNIYISPLLLVVLLLFSVLILPLFQYFFFSFFFKRMPKRKCIVLGKKDLWEDVITELSKGAVREFEVLAYFDENSNEEAIKEIGQVDFIIDALPHNSLGKLKIVYQEFGVVFSISKMFEESRKRVSLEMFREFEQYYEMVFSEIRLSRRVKILDFVYSFLLILIMSPILLFSVALILILDGGPIFYTQDRRGYLGKVFKIYKLRTMTETSNGVVSTRSGKILRKLRFNEIPQILNVLKGDMSLVGPRPDLMDTYKYCMDNIPYYKYRFNVLPGITGHAQVCYKYVDTLEIETFTKRLSYDLYYVKHLSAYVYLTILLRTIESVLMRRGQ